MTKKEFIIEMIEEYANGAVILTIDFENETASFDFWPDPITFDDIGDSLYCQLHDC